MGLGLLHGDLEPFQVYIPQGPLPHNAVGEHPVGLLVVAGVVLDGDAPAGMCLDALGDGGSDLAADKGVFRIVLEIPAAQGQAVDIQSGGQPQVDAETLHLLADHISAPAAELQVPALGQGGADGHGGAVLVEHLPLPVGLLLSHGAQTGSHVVVQEFGESRGQGHLQRIDPVLVLAVVLVQAQPSGTVRHDQHRQTLVLKEAGSLAGSAHDPHACVAHKALAALILEPAQADVGQLFVGKGGHQLPDLLRDLRQRGRLPGHIVLLLYRKHRRRLQFPGLSLIGKGLGFRFPVLKVGLAADVAQLAHQNGAFQPDHPADVGITAGGAQPQHIVSRFQNLTGGVVVKGGKILQGEGKGQGFLLTGSQFPGFGESRQGLVGLVQLPGRDRHIQLDHLFAQGAAGVLHRHVHGHLGAFHLHLRLPQGEGGVPQTVPKGEHRGLVHRVEIPVPHVNAFLVAGIVGLGKIPHLAVILPPGPGGGQLAGGIGLAQDHVRQGIPQRHAGLGEQQNIFHLQHGSQVHYAAHVEHQQEVFVLLPGCQNVPDLRLGQFKVAGSGRTVGALAGNAAQHKHPGIPFPIQRQVVLRFRHDGPHAQHDGRHTHLLGLCLDPLHKAGIGLLADAAVTVQPRLGGNGEPGVLQALFHSGVVAYVHVAGPGAAFNGLPGSAAIEGHLARRLQGEGAVAFQKHHAFRGKPPQKLAVFHLVLIQFHKVPPSRRLDGPATCISFIIADFLLHFHIFVRVPIKKVKFVLKIEYFS